MEVVRFAKLERLRRKLGHKIVWFAMELNFKTKKAKVRAKNARKMKLASILTEIMAELQLNAFLPAPWTNRFANKRLRVMARSVRHSEVTFWRIPTVLDAKYKFYVKVKRQRSLVPFALLLSFY